MTLFIQKNWGKGAGPAGWIGVGLASWLNLQAPM